MKPWPMSQISSSCRRTLRWLRANPPGRSDAASRSLMIQQNARGSRPWAQRPFMPPPSRRVRTSRRATAVRRRSPRRRAPARFVRRGRPTTPWLRACRRHAAATSSPSTLAMNDLREGPDEHRDLDAPDELRQSRQQRQVVGCGLPEADPGIRAQRSRRRSRAARAVRAVRRGSRRPRRRRRRTAALPASCAARRACA